MKYIDAIRSQGENLRRSLTQVTQSVRELDFAPWHYGRPAITGIGASFNAVLATAPTYQERGLDVVPRLASELLDPMAWTGLSAVIAVSQSGRSTETVACVSGTSRPCLALTDDPGSPLAAISTAHIPLALLEDSAVRTLGYTATVQALEVVSEVLSGRSPWPGWGDLPSVVEGEVKRGEKLAEQVASSFSSCASVDVVADRSSFGAAAQAALMFREACRISASAYETRDYLHGPLESAGEGIGVILIGEGRESNLAHYLSAAGATTMLITSADIPEDHGALVYRVRDIGALAAPILDVLPLQCLTWAVAQVRGLQVEALRYSQNDTKTAGVTEESP